MKNNPRIKAKGKGSQGFKSSTKSFKNSFNDNTEEERSPIKCKTMKRQNTSKIKELTNEILRLKEEFKMTHIEL
jgi:Sec-independent protein translocase protein TatA